MLLLNVKATSPVDSTFHRRRTKFLRVRTKGTPCKRHVTLSLARNPRPNPTPFGTSQEHPALYYPPARFLRPYARISLFSLRFRPLFHPPPRRSRVSRLPETRYGPKDSRRSVRERDFPEDSLLTSLRSSAQSSMISSSRPNQLGLVIAPPVSTPSARSAARGDLDISTMRARRNLVSRPNEWIMER